MRTIIISLAITAVCFTAQAGKNSLQYVITDSDTLICKNIVPGLVKTKCVLHSGDKKVVKNKEINLLCISGKIIEKKPIYQNDKYIGKEAMMELIDIHNGVKVFKYVYYNGLTNTMDLVVSFYKGTKFIHSQTNPNIAQVYNFIDQYTNNKKNFLTSK